MNVTTAHVSAAAAILGVKSKSALLPLLSVGVIVGTAGWFFFFAIFALRIRRNDIFLSLFYFLFLFSSSTFYPLAPLPRWFRIAALANPITWQVDFLRYTSIGLNSDYLLAESLAFILFTLAAFICGVRVLSRPK